MIHSINYSDFKGRFPELWAKMSAAAARKDLLKMCREIQKQIDEEGAIDVPYCDGAFFSFKKELLEQWRVERPAPSSKEERINRILNISYSDGKKKARSMNGRTRLY